VDDQQAFQKNEAAKRDKLTKSRNSTTMALQ